MRDENQNGDIVLMGAWPVPRMANISRHICNVHYRRATGCTSQNGIEFWTVYRTQAMRCSQNFVGGNNWPATNVSHNSLSITPQTGLVAMMVYCCIRTANNPGTLLCLMALIISIRLRCTCSMPRWLIQKLVSEEECGIFCLKKYIFETFSYLKCRQQTQQSKSVRQISFLANFEDRLTTPLP